MRSSKFGVVGIALALWLVLIQPPSAWAVTYPSAIPAGTVLQPGDTVTSANGQYNLRFQQDGNLVLYGLGERPLWYTGVRGDAGNRFVAQPDGNLVMYSSNRRVLWQSGTSGSQVASEFTVSDTGRLSLLTASRSTIWRSYSGQPDLLPGESLTAGQTLGAQRDLDHPDIYVIMQPDGNFVEYNGLRALWSTTTSGNPGAYATLQTDGNFRVFNAAGRPLTSTGVSSVAVTRFSVQPDGNLVIYRVDGSHGWNRGPLCEQGGACPRPYPWIP